MRLTCEKGELKAVNDEKFDDPIKAIQKVEEIGAAYGIGRDMHAVSYTHLFSNPLLGKSLYQRFRFMLRIKDFIEIVSFTRVLSI